MLILFLVVMGVDSYRKLGVDSWVAPTMITTLGSVTAASYNCV